MNGPKIEHVNVTVKDAKRTALLIETLFGWPVRWQGPAQNGGYTIHIGDENQYLALYQPNTAINDQAGSEAAADALNHIGIVVDNLQALEQRVINAGYKPFNHGDYEPGQRFYFYDADNIEYEIVSYR